MEFRLAVFLKMEICIKSKYTEYWVFTLVITNVKKTAFYLELSKILIYGMSNKKL